ncbi:hypothetical protein [Pseudomonas sp. PA1(2017)]|uniref:hypothetical protein n=1 Tax=Pseudomonas sp. PA1(2017) TaxID=1932113 RepID=UPI001115245C|nr:hypothetical protein [Pseudomonas sp. PA1(2017)]
MQLDGGRSIFSGNWQIHANVGIALQASLQGKWTIRRNLCAGQQLPLIVALQDTFAADGQLQVDSKAVSQWCFTAVVKNGDQVRQALKTIQARQHQGFAGSLTFIAQTDQLPGEVNAHRQADFCKPRIAHMYGNWLTAGLGERVHNTFGADPNLAGIARAITHAGAKPC